MKRKLTRVFSCMLAVSISFTTVGPVYAENQTEDIQVTSNTQETVQPVEQADPNIQLPSQSVEQNSATEAENAAEEVETVLPVDPQVEEPPVQTEEQQSEQIAPVEQTQTDALQPAEEVHTSTLLPAPTTIDFNIFPELLVTEIMADNAGTDEYEYFEVYNNSDKPLVLDHYNFAIRYTDGSNTDRPLKFEQATIQPKETMVMWLNVKNKTTADFNAHYGTNLTDEQVVTSTDAIGLYNSGNRAIVVSDETKEIAAASYTTADVASGVVAQYKYPESGTTMATFSQKAKATPGVIDAAQVPEKTVALPENAAPTVTHTPLTKAVTDQDVKVSATVTAEGVKATLFYQTAADTPLKELPMKQAGNSYEATIPAGELQVGTLQYYIKVTDKQHRVLLPSSEWYQVTVTAPVVADFNSYPYLLVTEMAPNSKGTGTDYYEYFEIYNNSNQPLDLANYKLLYRYTDGSKADVPFAFSATTIQPQETLTFWFNNGQKTLADFNANFGTALQAEQVVEFTGNGYTGMANTGNRAIVVQDTAGNELVSAAYADKETDNEGKVVQYAYPKAGTTMEKQQVLANPTPGGVEATQIPKQPVQLPDMTPDTVAPIIEHTAVATSEAYTKVGITAKITDDKANPSATLYYKKEQDASFTAMPMNASEEAGMYTADIPASFVDANLVYYIEATDGKNTAKTAEQTVTVAKSTIDFNKVPTFLVTEVVPDSTNVGSADGYEFVEIYNNTDQDINFKDYKLQYRYGADTTTDVIWPSIPDDVVIRANDTLVFWMINGQNNDKTVADFNKNYGTQLVENEDIVRVYTGGMANGSMRGLVVADNTKKEISVSYYNDQEGVDDTQPDKGILYQYPTDGSTVAKKVSAGVEAATPGKVEGYQVPVKPVHVEKDTVAPTVENVSKQTEVKETEDIKLAVDARDDQGIKTVKVYYKTNTDEAFKGVILPQDYNSLLYQHTIYSPEIIGKEEVEYYFVVSDGTTEVTSSTYKVKVTNERNTSSLRMNVTENEVVAREKVIKGTSQDEAADKVAMLIDGQEVSTNTYHALENTAYLAFEVSGVNTFFQNGVTMGDEVLRIFDDWILDWQTITVPIDPNRMQVGDNVLTIRSGNKASPFDLQSTENRDDYSLRNVRLVLGDGTIVRDATYGDPAKVIAMQDSNPFVDFHFNLTDEHATSKGYKWNTKLVADGKHTVIVKDSNETITTNVLVDNTAPVIVPSIEAEKQYKGAFTMDATVTDEIAGVASTEFTLDGNRIFTPYATSSAQLAPGAHTLHIKATDKAGNVSETSVPFTVADELPDEPELATPTGTIEGTPTLQVKVTDPTNDEMDVTFYQAFQYTPASTGMKSYAGAADAEPMIAAEGEQSVADQNLALISATDGQYLENSSLSQFPYHRFDVTIDPKVDATDTVELVWKGKSLEGRKVTMYAWSYTENKWKAVTYRIAGTEDFSLKGNVNVGEYAKDGQVKVLVQDEIPASSSDYDYTFVWMSDTQYYSESYPQIYDSQTQWIANNKDALKIKYVMHTGDLVDEADKDYQWNNASTFMKTLEDANIPYGVLAGNHDVDHKTSDYTQYSKYFGADRFDDKSYYGGTYENNRGHYDLISAGGNDYIMVYLGWGIDEEGIAWVNEVLAAHPDRKAILNFHEYLLASGSRHPMGEKLYNEVVRKNQNVFAVLSGHYHESQKLVDEIDDNGDGVPDRKVYQILADYQAGPEGGQGYMRLLHFDTKNNRIIVNTYSPYMNDYNFYNTDVYGDKDEFIIDLDLQPKEKKVATDSFTVNVYTDTVIGTDEDVQSGEYAKTEWNGLEENKTYSWYAVAKDDYTGQVASEIASFIKGKNIEPVDTVTPPNTEEPQNPKPTQPIETGVILPTPTNSNVIASPIATALPTTSQAATGESTTTSSNTTTETLPNTATSTYNGIFAGVLAILGGAAALLFRRKKRM